MTATSKWKTVKIGRPGTSDASLSVSLRTSTSLFSARGVHLKHGVVVCGVGCGQVWMEIAFVMAGSVATS